VQLTLFEEALRLDPDDEEKVKAVAQMKALQDRFARARETKATAAASTQSAPPKQQPTPRPKSDESFTVPQPPPQQPQHAREQQETETPSPKQQRQQKQKRQPAKPAATGSPPPSKQKPQGKRTRGGQQQGGTQAQPAPAAPRPRPPWSTTFLTGPGLPLFLLLEVLPLLFWAFAAKHDDDAPRSAPVRLVTGVFDHMVWNPSLTGTLVWLVILGKCFCMNVSPS
jgi:hypothetical protein